MGHEHLGGAGRRAGHGPGSACTRLHAVHLRPVTCHSPPTVLFVESGLFKNANVFSPLTGVQSHTS